MSDDNLPSCNACDRLLVCEICETCAEHCRYRDPVACAEAVVAFSVGRFGEDERTEVARGQLRRAAERMRLA